ncbi:PREDICTED: 85/88 kDa calcium-independent phospholipase A2-like [Amphimedon queenslandica]|uniref:phospholipase A2 n=1 Tax=Amphimedon queenslandica TaxID=400682 RepID=A0AAN0J1R8_AMPQE|nr:PREDICTED: 85/88 kDa calcium-independent phospholipase A2-like [Amphimedon queenslandica]|eukprot:XP_019850940.1 PREDICTED: 85/88 kDa calcium-independent phospholipase A2-like [Amphimedon queenslandica]
MEAKSIDYYHNLTLELLFENGTKLKPDYLYGEARETKLASVNGLAETATAAYVIILKANGDNWFLLYEGDEVTEETLHSLDDDLSELLNIDIKITVDLLNVFLQPEPDERLVERMMLEISKVWYLNFLRNGHEMTDGSEDYESDDKYDFVPVVITKQVENKFWEEAFCGPFHSENVPFPSAEQAEGIAAKLLKIDNSYSASISIIEAVEQGTYRSMSFALQLLLFGINPNQCKPSNGDTALHIAVRKDNEVMVKLLLAFKADLNIKNKTGKTPTDLAADKEKISHLDLTEVAEWQDKMKEHFASYPNLPERTRTGTYLMSLDGGGICGFNSITFLIALEDRMKELSPKCHPIHHYFDYIAGTSFGAIAALTLLYTNHSLRIGRCLVYQILKEVIALNHIDNDKRKNSMERNLQSIFKGKAMSSLKGPPHAIVTTTKHPDGMLCLMTSYGSNSEVESNHVWKAAHMSSAAPLIFPPVDGKYYDGGLMANDPTNAALGEISEIEQNCEFGCVLSIGTGSFKDPNIVDNLEYFCWNFPFEQILKPIKMGKAYMIISNYARAKELSNEESAKSLCETKGWEYHRWSPPLSRNIGPACKELNVIIDMMYHTEMHILQNPETIDNIAKCILARKTRPN